MIKCVMLNDKIRYFSEHVVHNISYNEDGELVLAYQDLQGQTAWAKIKEFMVVKTGVWLR
ncbi:hypothetical protein [Pseudodonghicola sp.]|uniref:hypothetical protein n=1 Tax=Pseudodonghicola sp. TaxID=1969463 RepID=UPI003A9697B8